MKKMVFSAMALFVFTATSFAGEIERKKVSEIKTNTIEVNNQLKTETPCADQWVINMGVLQDGHGATFEEAERIADRCFEQCLIDTYGE